MDNETKRHGPNSATIKSTFKSKYDKLELTRILYQSNNTLRVTLIYSERSNTTLWKRKIYQFTEEFNGKFRIAFYDHQSLNREMLEELTNENEPVVLQ